MINVIDKKQMYDSVIMGKENASKEWNCIISVDGRVPLSFAN